MFPIFLEMVLKMLSNLDKIILDITYNCLKKYCLLHEINIFVKLKSKSPESGTS